MTKAKLFNGMIKNIPMMFPHDLLEVELKSDEINQETFLLIKKTN